MHYLSLILILQVSIFFGQRTQWIIDLNAGEFERKDVPLFITFPEPIDPNKHYLFVEKEGQTSCPVLVLDEFRVITFVDYLQKQSRVNLELQEIPADQHKWPVEITQTNAGIQVKVEDKPVLFYQKETALPPAGQPEYYKRSGFIHPLQAPNGAVLTDDFPMGHVHQHALFNAWTNTTFKGEKVDFWNQQHQLGTVKHKKTLKVSDSQFQVQLSHLSLLHGEVLEENWEITVYPVKGYFLFDLLSTQINTSSDTLFLEEYIYGGMAFRGSREWNKDDTLHFVTPWKIRTDTGRDNETANHTKVKWLDASGQIGDHEAGVTVFGFPDNFRYPQSVRVHPEMPYWVYSPPVEGRFYIAPGEIYKSKYRYFVHNGSPGLTVIEAIERNISQPIEVKFYRK
jgi:hypothetical protein